jgi:hypothetical protein
MSTLKYTAILILAFTPLASARESAPSTADQMVVAEASHTIALDAKLVQEVGPVGDAEDVKKGDKKKGDVRKKKGDKKKKGERKKKDGERKKKDGERKKKDGERKKKDGEHKKKDGERKKKDAEPK